ncbi:MAG: group I truncated hemoglobin [Candidatus Sericytochromatia bacterium]
MKSAFVVWTLATMLVSGCAYTRQQDPVDPNASLYQRLGGMPAIEAVVSDFTGIIAQDERINGFFIGADVNEINRLLAEQICQASGGPCVYTGRDMISVHTGMNITEVQFNALVEDLIKSLDRHRVPAREQQELLTLLASMKEEIINR